MTWSVDTPRRVGDLTCAAIVECDVGAKEWLLRFYAHGEKRPLMILLLEAGEVRGIGLNGQLLNADEVEREYPGAVARFRDLAEARTKS